MAKKEKGVKIMKNVIIKCDHERNEKSGSPIAICPKCEARSYKLGYCKKCRKMFCTNCGNMKFKASDGLTL